MGVGKNQKCKGVKFHLGLTGIGLQINETVK